MKIFNNPLRVYGDWRSHAMTAMHANTPESLTPAELAIPSTVIIKGRSSGMHGSDEGEAFIEVQTDDYGRLLREHVTIDNRWAGRRSNYSDWYYEDGTVEIIRDGENPYTIQLTPTSEELGVVIDEDDEIPRSFSIQIHQTESGAEIVVCERDTVGILSAPLETTLLDSAGRVIQSGGCTYTYGVDGLMISAQAPTGFIINGEQEFQTSHIIRTGRTLSIAIKMLNLTVEYDEQGRPVTVIENFRGYDMGNYSITTTATY